MAALSLKILKPSQGMVTIIPSCNYASEIRPRELNTAAMKRGRGGRSSFSGDVVTVFGANGFIGTGLANRLGKNGSQMIFPYRGEHYKMMRLKVVGDLGQVLFCPFELKDEESIRRAVSHSNIVINCIGRGTETNNFSYQDVNVTGPARLAKICKEMGVQRFVHFSHINARAEPEKVFLQQGSEWLRTKYQGELAVRSEFPDATIFRCADVYGQDDNFINYWFSNWRKTFRTRELSLYGKGEQTIKQPIYRSDLLDGVMASLHDPQAKGALYEAVGPERMTQAELISYMYALTCRTEAEGNFRIKELMLDPETFAKAFFAQTIRLGNRYVFHQTGLDRLERDSLSDMSEGYPEITELGVKLSKVTDRMPFEVAPFDQYAYYFYETPEEKTKVRPYKVIEMDEEREILAKRSKGFLSLIPGANLIM